jgi:two-component system NtrC family sensor kinase
LARIIEKRRALHEALAKQEQENDALRSQNLQLLALANLGSATSMIAHEINNLLTPLGTYAALAARNPDDKELVSKALDRTVQNCRRASKIMTSMLAMANGQTQELESVHIRALVDDVFHCLCRDFKKDGITVDCQIPEDLTLTCVPVQIQHTMMNLILNAREAMLPGGGVLKIVATENAEHIDLTLSDTGKGIAPEDMEKLFKPFFTTKARQGDMVACSGSGVGLAFCKHIVEAHLGDISVTSRLGQGSMFHIRLPKQQP